MKIVSWVRHESNDEASLVPELLDVVYLLRRLLLEKDLDPDLEDLARDRPLRRLDTEEELSESKELRLLTIRTVSESL